MNTLNEDERGLANGLMFAGAAVGQGIGGSGVLLLISVAGFQAGIVAVAMSLFAVTLFVALPMREAPSALLESAGRGWRAAVAGMRKFAAESFRDLFERHPDLFVRVYDAAGREVASTQDAVRWNAGAVERVDLAVPSARL